MRKTISTFRNIFIDPFDADISQIHIEDIAHSLSLQCRFNGHSARMWSVARHSINVASQLKREGYNKEEQLAGLLHDASEAYLCDIPSPIKRRPEMEFYRKAEDDLMGLIFSKYKLRYPLSDAVLQADNDQTMSEVYVGRYTFESYPHQDKIDFLKLFSELYGMTITANASPIDTVFIPKQRDL